MVTERQNEALRVMVNNDCDGGKTGDILFPNKRLPAAAASDAIKRINKDAAMETFLAQNWTFEDSVKKIIQGFEHKNPFIQLAYLNLYYKLIGAFAATKIDVRTASFERKEITVTSAKEILEVARKVVMEKESEIANSGGK